jgi:hypothetical protein
LSGDPARNRAIAHNCYFGSNRVREGAINWREHAEIMGNYCLTDTSSYLTEMVYVERQQTPHGMPVKFLESLHL